MVLFLVLVLGLCDEYRSSGSGLGSEFFAGGKVLGFWFVRTSSQFWVQVLVSGFVRDIFEFLRRKK